MWGELGGGRGNLMCVPHDLHNHIFLTTTANGGLSFTFLSPWQLTTPPPPHWQIPYGWAHTLAILQVVMPCSFVVCLK